jgi:hypothetical protein
MPQLYVSMIHWSHLRATAAGLTASRWMHEQELSRELPRVHWGLCVLMHDDASIGIRVCVCVRGSGLASKADILQANFGIMGCAQSFSMGSVTSYSF